MTLKKTGLPCTAAFLSTLALTSQAQLAATSTSTAVQKPAWLTDLSVGFKQGYDDNVFASGVSTSGLPIQPGSAAALKNVGSWVTTFSPKIGVDVAPLMSGQTVLEHLSLAYVPDFAIYENAATESYDAHRLAGVVKGKTGALSFSEDDLFTYIHGNKYGPTYPGEYISALGIAAPRERREQMQDKSATALQYDMGNWFVRTSASFLMYDLMTEHFPAPATGYLNYVSRQDLNAGPDAGYKMTHDLAVTLGYRYGYQDQEELFDNPMRSTSTYQRALLGLEGKPLDWLDVKIQGGPDFRDYIKDAPVKNRHHITYYGDVALAATISPKDTLTFKFKGWQWVSCIGYIPYFDSSYDLTYHHKFSDKLGLDLEGRLATANYDMGTVIERDDLLYTVSAGLTYAFNSHIGASLAYSIDLGRSADDSGNDVGENQYDRQMVSLATIIKF